MPMGLPSSMAEGPPSKWDGLGMVPTEGEPLTPCQHPCQAPGCSWWIGPHMTRKEMLQPPAPPLLCRRPSFPWDLSLPVGCRSKWAEQG